MNRFLKTKILVEESEMAHGHQDGCRELRKLALDLVVVAKTELTVGSEVVRSSGVPTLVLVVLRDALGNVAVLQEVRNSRVVAGTSMSGHIGLQSARRWQELAGKVLCEEHRRATDNEEAACGKVHREFPNEENRRLVP